ncbi:hypothetical protein TRIATDRAFT_90691, partial [Trichoderma atroviride IMI 206040]
MPIADEALEITDTLSKLHLHGLPLAKASLITVEEAFAYHKILYDYRANPHDDDDDDDDDENDGEDGGDGESDDEDEEDEDEVSFDEFDSDIDSFEESYDEDDDDDELELDSDEEEEDTEDEDGADGNDEDENAEIGIQLIRVGFDNPLLVSSIDEDQDISFCANSAVHSHLWAADPDLKLKGYDMGFLSQLAHLCIEAKLQSCHHQGCLDKRRDMEVVAPNCNWATFRDWVLTSMSCQASMSAEQKLTQAHTHIARAVAGCCMILKDCSRNRPSKRFRPFLDGHWSDEHRIDLAEVSNLIYWMAKIQSEIGIGPKKFGRWNHRILPAEVTMPSIESAALKVEDMGICKNRLWNLVNVSDRKQSDLPDIIRALEPHQQVLRHKDHDFCTPSKCQWAQMDSTSVGQLHKCGKSRAQGTENDVKKKTAKRSTSQTEAETGLNTKDDTGPVCDQKVFPIELLETAVELGKSTAWLCRSPQLSGPKDPYIAISHVWSDGTGVGVKDGGTVNSCLFNFFADIAKELDCRAIWWDAISIPSERKARSKAISKMHNSYSNAQFTVVHDSFLLNVPWKDDGSPCLALVLSTWFTRGWTALELIMSKKVKVLFGNPEAGKRPVVKDLDSEVLAQNPAVSSRAHWLATSLIHRLRRPIEDIGDLLAVLSPRSTSWARDRTIIAALLAGVPNCDFTAGESIITSKILEYVGKIPYTCLLHGKPTMRDSGQYSWCAATLDDMPVETSSDVQGGVTSKSQALLDIDEDGAIEGKWYCRAISAKDVKQLKISPYGDDLAAVVKVQIALRYPHNCLLLRPSLDSDDDRALLVVPMSIVTSGPVLKCRYVGAVNMTISVAKDMETAKNMDKNTASEDRAADSVSKAAEKEVEDDNSDWSPWTIRLGGKENSKTKMGAESALDKMEEYTYLLEGGEDDKSITGDDNDNEGDALEASLAKAKLQNEVQMLRWLTDEKVQDYMPLQMVQWDDETTVIEINEKSLISAVKSMNENAVRYLVKKNVVLTPRDLRISKASPRAAKMLGDIYSDNDDTLDQAIEVYNYVILKYRRWKSCSVDDLMRWYFTEYALGSAYVRTGEYAEAEKRFSCVLRACERKSKLREAKIGAKAVEAASTENRNDSAVTGEMPQPGMLQRTGTSKIKRTLTRSLTAIDPKTATTADKAKADKDKAEENRLKSDQRWYKLQLNAITELTLLDIAQFNFDGATDTYKRALRKFGDVPKDMEIEAFGGLWGRRRFQSFQDKDKSDEKAAGIYQRALRRFDTMFRKDHMLILITALHLGINYMNRSRFSDAESLLMRALDGFVARLYGPLPDKQTALELDDKNEHRIITLTRYYVGVLFTSQQRLDEADVQLRRVIELASSQGESFQSEMVRLSAICALGQNTINRHGRKLNSRNADKEADKKAEELFTAVLEACNNGLDTYISTYADDLTKTLLDNLLEKFLEKCLDEHFDSLLRQNDADDEVEKRSLWEKETYLQEEGLFSKGTFNGGSDGGLVNLSIQEKESYLQRVPDGPLPEGGVCNLSLQDKKAFLRASGYLPQGEDDSLSSLEAAKRIELQIEFSGAHILNIAHQAKLGLIGVFFKRGEERYDEENLSYIITQVSDESEMESKNPFLCDARILVSTIYEDDDEKIAEAEVQVKATLRALEYLEGKQSLTYLQMERRLGVICLKLGKTKEAQESFEEALDNLEQSMGAYHSQTLKVSWRLGRIYLDQGHLDDAELACDRAYQGFNKTSGSESKWTAEAAQTLGEVYFRKGSISKAKDMYRKAFDAFKALVKKPTATHKTDAPEEKKQQKVPPWSQDRPTLLAAMDLAKVCAMIPEPSSRSEALNLYKHVVNGLSSATKRELRLNLIEARLKLAGVYRELRKLEDAAQLIRHAFSSSKALRELKTSKPLESKEAEVSYAECQFRLGQLKLEGYESDILEEGLQEEDFDNHGGRTGRSLIEDSRHRLEELLGETHPLVLEASTILGQLRLGGEDESDVEEGIEILENVLKHYTSTNDTTPGIPKLAPGDPRIIRVINSLINCFDRREDAERVKDMESRKWEQLKSAYGIDHAAMIMDITQSKHLDHEQYYEDIGAHDDIPDFEDSSEESDEEDSEEEYEGAWNDDDLSSFNSDLDSDSDEESGSDEDGEHSDGSDNEDERQAQVEHAQVDHSMNDTGTDVESGTGPDSDEDGEDDGAQEQVKHAPVDDDEMDEVGKSELGLHLDEDEEQNERSDDDHDDQKQVEHESTERHVEAPWRKHRGL